MHLKLERNLSSGLERRVNIKNSKEEFLWGKQTNEANKKFHLEVCESPEISKCGFLSLVGRWQSEGEGFKRYSFIRLGNTS